MFKKSCHETLILLGELATLQASFLALNEIVRVTNRRVNALKYLLLPRLNQTFEFISAELEDRDLEEFHRVKKARDKQNWKGKLLSHWKKIQSSKINLQ